MGNCILITQFCQIFYAIKQFAPNFLVGDVGVLDGQHKSQLIIYFSNFNKTILIYRNIC